MLLSVCVLTYNRVELLKKLIDSILESTLLESQEVELVLLNNASTDSTRKYLESFSSRENIRVFHRDTNQRGSMAYLQLLGAARGEWVIAPGDDDIFISGNLINAFNNLKSTNKQTMLMPFAAQTINSSGDFSPIKYQPPEEMDRVKLLSELINKSIYWFPATFFRRALVIDNQTPRTVTVFDWWIWIQGVIAGQVEPNTLELINYRIHNGQEQLSYSESFWNLDQTRTFLDIFDSQSFKRFFVELDSPDIKKFLNFLNYQEGPSNSTEGLLLWLMLGEAIIECQPKTKDIVLEFLLKKDIDVRYLAQYFDKDLEEGFTRMALEHKGISKEEISKIKGKDELEKKLNEVLYNVRQTEKDNSLTPFEGRIISLYRLIRFSTLIRRVLKK
jgi:glycosyltransferase involved in cell wall biosynthesis